jgi:hypothetical protein
VAIGSTNAESLVLAYGFVLGLQLGNLSTSGGTSRRSWLSATEHGWQDFTAFGSRMLTRSSVWFPAE